MSGWIQTFRGLAFHPLDPCVEDIHIEDIAHALALQCRFTGHVREFYSVGQHSVYVSQFCPREHALWGLLHDAAEAYLSDVSRPVKRLAAMDEYRAAEKRLMAAICRRFDLPEGEPPEVKRADTLLLGIEARDLMAPLVNPEAWAWCTNEAKDHPLRITRCWPPAEAEERFLARFHELRTGADLGAAARLLVSARRRARRVADLARSLFDGEAA